MSLGLFPKTGQGLGRPARTLGGGRARHRGDLGGPTPRDRDAPGRRPSRGHRRRSVRHQPSSAAGWRTLTDRWLRLMSQPRDYGGVIGDRWNGTLKAELEAWRDRSLAAPDVFGLYLDAIVLRVRRAGKVTSVPVLGVVAILTDGQKQLVALELCGSESFEAWKGCLDDLVARGLGAPVLCVIDGWDGTR